VAAHEGSVKLEVRRLAVLFLALGACSGCMGSKDDETEVSARDVFAEYMSKTASTEETGFEDRRRMWRLLSDRTQQQWVGSWDRWNLSQGLRAQDDLRHLSKARIGSYENFSPKWSVAVASTATGAAAYASPLVLEHGFWKLEPYSALEVAPVAPKPGTTVAADAAVKLSLKSLRAPSGFRSVDEVHVWIDDHEVEARTVPTTGGLTVSAVAEGGLESGRHLVTALAVEGGEAAAVAWPFQVR
jgi:hypothetical protein